MSRLRRVLLLAALLPALAGLLAAFRLARAGWAYARWGEDPVVTAVVGSGARDEVPSHALRAAAASAPADFRFPYWSGRRTVLSPSATPEDLLTAFEELRRAAELAPSVAEVRYYLSVAAARLGRFGVADEEAHAALSLAPLQKDLSRRLAAWFFERYRRTGDEAQLAAAIRAGGLPEYESRAWLDMPLMTFEEAQRILDLADVAPETRVDLLLRANRYEWAIRAVPETGKALAARVHRAYGRYLLSIGAFADAAAELSTAVRIEGPSAEANLDLGVARARLGNREAAEEAFAAALGAGAPPGDVDAAMARGGIDAAGRGAFWEARREDGGPGVALALGRARLEQRRLPEAERALRDALTGPAATEAEASFLLARLFVAAGNEDMARTYAQRATELAPEQPEYRKLASSLGDKGE